MTGWGGAWRSLPPFPVLQGLGRRGCVSPHEVASLCHSVIVGVAGTPRPGRTDLGGAPSTRPSALQPAWGGMFHHEALSVVPREGAGLAGPGSRLRAFQSGDPSSFSPPSVPSTAPTTRFLEVSTS